MTTDDIKEAYAALTPEQRSECMQALNNDPQYSQPLKRAMAGADGSETADLVLHTVPYQLGNVEIPAPGPSWYERLSRVKSPYVNWVGSADGEDFDVVGYLMDNLTDTDIRVALYLLACGVDAIKPVLYARRRGGEESEALAEIDIAAEEWYEATGAGIQAGSDLVALVMSEHPYPSVVTGSQKKTPEH